MKKVYLVSGLGIAGLLAYLFVFKKTKKLEQQLQNTDNSPIDSVRNGGILGSVIDLKGGNAIDKDSVLESASSNNNTEEEEAKFYLDKFNDILPLWKREMKTFESTSRGKQAVYPPYYNHYSALNPCVIESKGSTWGEKYRYGQNYGRKTEQYILSMNEYLCKLEGLGYVYTNGQFVKGSVLR
jgi:hypothetical protein